MILLLREWQNRPLERKYAIGFMDAVHFHVREDNRTVKKAVSYTHLDVYKRQLQCTEFPKRIHYSSGIFI